MPREELEKIIREILPKGHLMSLATVDDGGPWVSDVIYIYDDALNLYWISDPATRHSKALLQNSNVALTITVSNKSKEPNEGLQIAGVAEKLEGKQYELTKLHWGKRGKPPPAEDSDYLEGDLWYKITPKLIDIISEPLWGFNKQSISF